MSQAVFLVLSLLGEPSAAEREVMAIYEHSRHIRLVRPEPPRPAGVPATYPAYDSALVGELEGDLDRARTAAVSLDETRARDLLESVERRLRQHPELPQAAWLMAERLRQSAARAGAAADAAARDLVQAIILEGARGAEFGENALSATLPKAESVTIEGLDVRDRLELDGEVQSERQLSLLPGEHHVRVVRGERIAFASWVRVGAGARAVDLKLPAVAPCSSDDLAGVTLEAGQAKAAAGTRCARWVVASRAAGGLNLADCFGARCSPFVYYRAERQPAPLAFPAQPERERPSRVLVDVALASTAAILLAGAIVWQAGAFDDEPEARSEWVYGGVSPAP